MTRTTTEAKRKTENGGKSVAAGPLTAEELRKMQG